MISSQSRYSASSTLNTKILEALFKSILQHFSSSSKYFHISDVISTLRILSQSPSLPQKMLVTRVFVMRWETGDTKIFVLSFHPVNVQNSSGPRASHTQKRSLLSIDLCRITISTGCSQKRNLYSLSGRQRVKRGGVLFFHAIQFDRRKKKKKRLSRAK